MTEILVLTEKIELLEERAAEMQEAFDTLRDSLNQLEAKLAEIEDAVCRLDMDVDERVTDVQRSAEYDIDELRNSLDDLSRRVEAMDDFLTVVDERDAEEDGRIGFEIHGLEERIAALEQDRAQRDTESGSEQGYDSDMDEEGDMGNDFDVVEEVFEDTPTPQASDVRHPEVHVSLTGLDGEAFSILGTVQKAMRRAGVSKEECSLYLQEATAGDYDELLQVTMRWVDWS